MAFKEVNSLDTDNMIALGGFNKKNRSDNPTQVEGYFLGSKEVASPKSKTGLSKIHVFQTASGNLGVWGKTDLDRKLGTAPVGAMVRATFTGLQSIPGKNDMYKYKVEVDTENTIEVAPSAENDSEPTYADDLDDIDSEEDAIDEAPVDRATAPRTPAKAPDPAASARVKALLAGKR